MACGEVQERLALLAAYTGWVCVKGGAEEVKG